MIVRLLLCQGESLLPLLQHKLWQRELPIYFEHEGNATVRTGPFKLVRLHGSNWELYDMETDRTELNNIVHGNTSIVQDLENQYDHWACTVGVLDWGIALPKLLAAWNLSSADG